MCKSYKITDKILYNFYYGILDIGNYYNVIDNLTLDIFINVKLDMVDKLNITCLYIDNKSNRYYFKNKFFIFGCPRLLVRLLEQQL